MRRRHRCGIVESGVIKGARVHATLLLFPMRKPLCKIATLSLILIPIALQSALASNQRIKLTSNSFIAGAHTLAAMQLYFNCIAHCTTSDNRSYLGLLRSGTTVVSARGYTISAGPERELEVKFLHANASALAVPSHQVGMTSYFSGVNPASLRWALPNYQRLAYLSIYPGIDVVYYGRHGDLEYDFDVHPHADISHIAIELPKKPFRIRPDGSIIFLGASRHILQEKPIAYQHSGLDIQKISARYTLDKTSRVIRITLGHYNHNLPLIIDPLILQYGVYRDGGNVQIDDGVIKVFSDASGNLYVAGTATDGAYPEPGGTVVFSSNGQTHAPYCYFGCTYLEKYAANGNLIYSTIIDGAHSNDMVVDSRGNVYLAGYTTIDFPTTIEVNNSEDGFVTEVSADGSQLVYSRKINMFSSVGSSDYLSCDGIQSIAVDSQGDLYFAASSPYANDGPWTTPNALQSTQNGSSTQVIGEFDPTGNTLLYGSYWGGSGSECPTSIMFDSSGSLYVVGRTTSTDFPVTSGAYGGGDYQGYITKFNVADWTVDYSQYFGGNNTTTINHVESDRAGGVYIGGETWSTDLPGTVGAYQSIPASKPSGFISHLDAGGNIIASTYFGGSVRSEIETLTLDSSGDIFFGGRTLDADLPITTDAIQDFNVAAYGLTGSGFSAFIAELTGNLQTLLYGSYYGGNFSTPVLGYPSGSELRSLSVGANSTLYAGGETETSDAPVTVPFTDSVPTNSGSNGFWAVFRSQNLVITTPTLFALLLVNTPFRYPLAAIGGTPPYIWQISTGGLPGGLSLSAGGVLSGELTSSLLPEPLQKQFDFVLTVTDANNQSASKYFFMPFDYPITISGGTTAGTLTVNTSYTDYITLEGGYFSFDCSIASGELPPGLTLENTTTEPACLIAGTPTKTGQYTYTLQVSDALGQRVNFGPFTLNVSAAQTIGATSSKGGGGYFGLTNLFFILLCLMVGLRRSRVSSNPSGCAL